MLPYVDADPTNDLAAYSLNEERERVLSETELVQVWNACGDDNHGMITKLLVLPGSRRAEIGKLIWSEVDFQMRQVELPEHRAKNGLPHIIPLSDQALEIVKAVPRGDRDLLFGRGASGFSGWAKSKAELDARIVDAHVN